MEPRPAPQPAYSNANEQRLEGDPVSDRKHQNDQTQIPESDALVKKPGREAGTSDIENAKALEEAAQRGRTA